MLRSSILAACIAAAVANPTQAEDMKAQDAFIEANILSIFYHELGHAVIDIMDVPIFGQEEDAADVMAVLLIDWLFEEETAQSLAYDSAFGYINDPDSTEEISFWDVHGPDEQRYYNHVCLFYGANPADRSALADDLELPEERAEYCPEEYEQAAASWGAIFDEMEGDGASQSIIFEAGTGADANTINRILRAEVAQMNGLITLPEVLRVKVAECEEANAFYDPEEVSITFCTEFIPHLRWIYQQL